ncbi:MAG: class I tRNA ligase family protein, partial [Candidatus Levybacteria bacterium]|nr:class I tRNA ligase family protein [Candidatus Levybacteria bacterium]
YNLPAFKNVVVEGVILGTDGRKMSKNYGNYPDPKELLQKYGGDALRLYLLGSPVMHGEDIIISEEAYRQQVKGTVLILWNAYSFFVTYANVDSWSKGNGIKSEDVLDKWILSLLNRLIEEVSSDLDNFDTVGAISRLQKFISEFSTWYIRRSRDRVGPSAKSQEDKNAFYATTFEILITLSKLLSPIAPFISEEIFRNLAGEESVHLELWPEEKNFDKELISQMELVRKIVEMGHSQRKENNIRVRQPLSTITYSLEAKLPKDLEDLLLSELNIKTAEYKKGKINVNLGFKITPELEAEGEARDIVRKIQEERKKLGTKLDERVEVQIEDWPKEFESEIKRRALVNSISKGKFRVIPASPVKRTSLGGPAK